MVFILYFYCIYMVFTSDPERRHIDFILNTERREEEGNKKGNGFMYLIAGATRIPLIFR